jgi:hypothetical protein
MEDEAARSCSGLEAPPGFLPLAAYLNIKETVCITGNVPCVILSDIVGLGNNWLDF